MKDKSSLQINFLAEGHAGQVDAIAWASGLA
jgi:hypothetical protein